MFESIIAGWLFGTTANTLLAKILKAIRPAEFETQLKQGLQDWNQALPASVQLPEPYAIFRYSDVDTQVATGSDIEKVRALLNEGTPPSVDLFHSALIEQWRRTREIGPEQLVDFFQLSEAEAGLHLRSLAETLENKVVRLVDFGVARLHQRMDDIQGAAPTHLIDPEIETQHAILQKYRFAGEFPKRVDPVRFAQQMMPAGNLSLGTTHLRSAALGSCVRLLLADKKTHAIAQEVLAFAELNLPQTVEVQIASALSKTPDDPIPSLMAIDVKAALGAAFNNKTITTSVKDALSWLDLIGKSFEDLPQDAQTRCIIDLQSGREWDTAYECARTIDPKSFCDWPILALVAAISLMAKHVREDLRDNLRIPAIMNPAQFPLAGNAGAKAGYMRALDALKNGYEQARQDNFNATADSMLKIAIWLGLRVDHEGREHWQEQLSHQLTESATAYKFADLGLLLAKTITMEQAELMLRRQMAISTEPDVDATLGLLALISAEPDVNKRVDRFLEHKPKLQNFFGIDTLMGIEFDILINAKRFNEAALKIEELEKSHPEAVAELKRVMASLDGTDVTGELIERYKDHRSYNTLHDLVAVLAANHDFRRLEPYAKDLFETTKSAEDAHRYISTLDRLGDLSTLSALLRAHEHFRAWQDARLDVLIAHVLFNLGHFREAHALSLRLRNENGRSDAIPVEINALVFSGDWEELEVFAREVERRTHDDYDALSLLQLANIVIAQNPTLASQLVELAMKKDVLNAHEYLAAYTLSVKLGHEDQDRVAEWFRRAQELSGDDGPIEARKLSDVVALQQDWQDRSGHISNLVFSAQLPLGIAAKALNRTSMDMIWLTAERNRHQTDARQAQVIPARFGRKIKAHSRDAKIGCLSMESLWLQIDCGLLDYTFQLYDTIVVPHSCFHELLEGSEKLRFHQPSLVKKARRMLRLVGDGVLHRDTSTPTIPAELINEVGFKIAKCLSIAQQMSNEGNRSLYVYPGTITKVTTLGAQKADIEPYQNNHVGCRPMVEYLRANGVISAQQAQTISVFLEAQGDTASGQRLETPVTLILDTLACDFLAKFDLLSTLKSEGFDIHLIPEAISEYSELIEHDDITAGMIKKLDAARRLLRNHAKDNRLQFLPLPDGEPSDETSDTLIQTVGVCALYDELISDDRTINRNEHVSDRRGNRAAIISTFELIHDFQDTEFLSDDERQEVMARIWSGFYGFVPLEARDLLLFVTEASVEDGVLVETKELRTIREYVLKTAALDWLQIPLETFIPETIRQAVDETIEQLWRSALDADRVGVCANWLIDLYDSRNMLAAQKFPAERVIELRALDHWRRSIRPGGLSLERTEAFNQWVETGILDPLTHGEPQVADRVIEFTIRLAADDV